MQTYELLVRNRSISGNSPDMTLVRTSVGVDQVHVLFDNAEWLDFPVSITFTSGGRAITKSLIVSAVAESEWSAEGTVVIPWEVVERVGDIWITLQGTDSNGNHIVTAKGSPLHVEEAGDVFGGEDPDDAPVASEWQQAYSDAMTAVGEAAALVSNLQTQLTTIVNNAKNEIDATIDELVDTPVASPERIGGIKVGDGLSIDENGVLSVNALTVDISSSMMLALQNLSALARSAFDNTFDSDGRFVSGTLKPSAIPRATETSFGVVIPDGATITVNENGVIRYDLPIATDSTLGGVMPDGTTIRNNNGLISARTATVSDAGIVRPDGTTITVNNGVISASGGGAGGYTLPVASTDQLGGVKVDGTTISIDSNGVLSIAFDLADEVWF